MNLLLKPSLFLFLLFVPSLSIFSQTSTALPVSPKASPETKALLDFFYQISGKHTLSGQHNFPSSGDRNTQFASNYIGKTPAVWSQDFGFAKAGDQDSYLARPDIIKEAIRQHKLGSVITLCWHAVPPTADEPVTFQPLPGYDTMKLASVQGKLQEQQFKDLLTPGTAIYQHWLKQVDEIAAYLKQLQDAHVPVLWRPYHEMNGDWFWWGGRYEGKYTTAALYRQLFDRMVNYHKLNNLVWVWSVDRPSQPGREFDKYYPGNEYLDILAIDIYGNDFNPTYYDGLLALSKGKPMVLGEVGNPPALDILEKQPRWAYWVIWSGMVRGTAKAEYEKQAASPRVLFLEDRAYSEATASMRKTFGFEKIKTPALNNFSGEWILNEYESKIENAGGGNIPYKLNIIQKEKEMQISSTSIVEWADDVTTHQTLTLDGQANNSTVFNNSPRIQKLSWSENRDSLFINSKTQFNFGGNPFEVTGKESWILKRKGKKLEINQTVTTSRGVRNSILVYDNKF